MLYIALADTAFLLTLLLILSRFLDIPTVVQSERASPEEGREKEAETREKRKEEGKVIDTQPPKCCVTSRLRYSHHLDLSLRWIISNLAHQLLFSHGILRIIITFTLCERLL